MNSPAHTDHKNPTEHPDISIIIPAYNEALRIRPTLVAIEDYFRHKNMSYEIIVVDDGSRDTTRKVVEDFRTVKLLVNELNKGKGYSVKRGMLVARGKLRLFMDADHSVKIDNLDRFIAEINKGADIVIGSIELPGSAIQDDNYRYRRVFGKWAKTLIRATTTPGIYDTQSGFKLFTERTAEEIFPQLMTLRWGFDIEIIARAQKRGMSIKEIAVEWNNSKASSVTLGSYFLTLLELVKIKSSL